MKYFLIPIEDAAPDSIRGPFATSEDVVSKIVSAAGSQGELLVIGVNEDGDVVEADTTINYNPIIVDMIDEDLDNLKANAARNGWW